MTGSEIEEKLPASQWALMAALESSGMTLNTTGKTERLRETPMKRLLIICAAVILLALIAFLAISAHLSSERADRLDRALMDAEARVVALETEIEAARQRLAALSAMHPQPVLSGTGTRLSPTSSDKGQLQGDRLGAAPGPAASATGPSTIIAPATVMPGSWFRYAAVAAPGLTNFVRIEGTSTIHPWQVESRLIGGSAEFGSTFPPAPGAIVSTGTIPAKVSVFIPVRSLKSIEKDGRPYSDAMDEIMYGKLLAETHKRITYNLISLSLLEPRASEEARFVCEATGDLCVAGITNRVTMPVSIAQVADGKLQFTGSVKVKMTGFKIVPPNPSFAGGAIKTGDEVTLSFAWWANRVRTLEAAK